MDQDDSYSVQTGDHCFAGPHWDEQCSCDSSITQSSENINKPPLSHSQVYTPEGNPQDYLSSALRVIPPNSKTGSGKGNYSNLQPHYGSSLCTNNLISFYATVGAHLSGLYHYWPDHWPTQFAGRSYRSSSIQASSHPTPFDEECPSELESRLELLQSQLNR